MAQQGQEARSHRDHHAEVTQAIIAQLEKGVLPWRQGWAGSHVPMNPTTGNRAYHGINRIMLGMNPAAVATGDPRFCSYEQAKAKGWQVNAGAKACLVYFFKRYEVDEKDAGGNPVLGSDGKPKSRTIPLLRASPVFHASQISGIPAYEKPTPAAWQKPEAINQIAAACGCPIEYAGVSAYYSLTGDFIRLPPEDTFESPQTLAATLAHECLHSTGHPSRLNRNLRNRFASAAYALEELTAEIGATMVLAELGGEDGPISPDVPNHASYVDGWLKCMREDAHGTAIFTAAAAAAKASDFLLEGIPEFKLAREAERAAEAAVETAITVTVAASPEPSPTEAPPTLPTPKAGGRKRSPAVEAHLAQVRANDAAAAGSKRSPEPATALHM